MYKNIIFDFGGVVVDFAPRSFLMDHFMNRRAEEETYELVFGSQEWQDLDRGTITREAANKQMLEHAAEAGRIFEVQTCIDEWATMLRTKDDRAGHAQAEAVGYRLYYLTNIPTDIMDELRQRSGSHCSTAGLRPATLPCASPRRRFYNADARPVAWPTMSRFLWTTTRQMPRPRTTWASPVFCIRTRSPSPVRWGVRD